MRGKVKWFNSSKGYGFITGEDWKDVFAHYSSIQVEGYKELKENDAVEFDVVPGEKGLAAKNIVKV